MAAIAMPPRVKGAGMMDRAPAPTDDDYAEDMAEGGVEDDADEDEGDTAKLDDSEILSILDAEKQSSIGFENGTELERKRRTSLEYSKGQMDDVPSLPNRSKATSTDIAEAVETVLPDLMEIFTGGEDVATFEAVGKEDEEAAQQETDYVQHVAFQKMRGFLLLYTAIKDALQVDTGIIKTTWQDKEEVKEEKLKGITAVQLEMAKASGAEIVESVQTGMDMSPDEATGQIVPVELFDATVRMKYDKGCIKSVAVDPSNLTVASDATLDLEENVYLAVRSFPRAQALLDSGFDEDKVAMLPGHVQRQTNDETEQARDVAGETTSVSQDGNGTGGPDGKDGRSVMRTVEIHEHYIRADFEQTGKSQLWCVVTDADCKVLLHKKKVDRHGISVGTPFIQAHRFYGMSLAEKLIEIQKIKTALLRMMLDSGYFAMNQRTEIAMDKANEFTIADLMRNEPMSPVRSRTGDAVRPLQAGQLGFDVGMMLEYTSTMSEQRTGVVRNAQGLNPDTLHDTAKGQQALMSMAQKRIRMIARVLAETLIKGWYLDIHALSRKHGTRAEKIRLRGKWVDIDPTTFGDRSDMTIEVGVGSGGKEMELAGLAKVIEFQKEMIASGIPEYMAMASPKKTWNAATRFARKVGFKSPEMFFEDPEELAQKAEQAKAERAAQGIPEEPPPPSPEEIQAKATMEIEQAKAQNQAQLKQMELAAAEAKAQRDHELALRKLEQEQVLAREKMATDALLARERMQVDGTLNNYKEQMAAQKLALENEWTKIEMQSSEMKRASEERQAELAARETQLREQNDAAKIAADTRAAELEALTAERTFELEQQKIALEYRKMEMQERSAQFAASQPPVSDPTAGRPSSPSTDATAVAMMALAEAMTRKKSVIRGPDGKVEGIE